MWFVVVSRTVKSLGVLKSLCSQSILQHNTMATMMLPRAPIHFIFFLYYVNESPLLSNSLCVSMSQEPTEHKSFHCRWRDNMNENCLKVFIKNNTTSPLVNIGAKTPRTQVSSVVFSPDNHLRIGYYPVPKLFPDILQIVSTTKQFFDATWTFSFPH